MTFNNADMLSTSHGCASCEGRASHFLHVKSDGRHSPVCGDVSAASRANYRQSSEFTPFVWRIKTCSVPSDGPGHAAQSLGRVWQNVSSELTHISMSV